MDVDGILKVSTREEGSGVSNHIVLAIGCGWVSKAEIERMVRDAKWFQREDEETKRDRTTKF